jgi:HSP20 family protein
MFTHRGTAFDKMVDKMFENISEPIWKTTWVSTEQPINYYVENNTLHLALPGYNTDELDIEVEGMALIISAEIEEKDSNKFKQSFTKKFELRNDIDTDSLKASYEAGVLSIQFAKKTETKKVKIS